jgi:hypothetical protein
VSQSSCIKKVVLFVLSRFVKYSYSSPQMDAVVKRRLKEHRMLKADLQKRSEQVLEQLLFVRETAHS